MFEIGDTICNIYDYNNVGKIKGHILSTSMNMYVILITSNGKKIIDTYIKPFSLSRIVLLEKFPQK